MKNIFQISAFILGLIICDYTKAQNVLPAFSVKEISRGKVQISWKNPFPTCIQIAVQRSGDSSKNFRSIYSPQSPELPQNGFVDVKTTEKSRWYYRIFYVLTGGNYYFTNIVSIDIMPVKPPKLDLVTLPVTHEKQEPKKYLAEKKMADSLQKSDLVIVFCNKAIMYQFKRDDYIHFRDSIQQNTKDGLYKISNHEIEWVPSYHDKENKLVISIYKDAQLVQTLTKKALRNFKDSIKTKTRDTLVAIDKNRIQIHGFIPKPKTYISIYQKDSLLTKVEAGDYKKFKDSIKIITKDTLVAINNYRSELHSFKPKYVWQPSDFVYTSIQGYLIISLPNAKNRNFSIIFYDTDNTELFRMKNLKETQLILDKSNFLHAGWFSFELFENNKLIEKNSFQLVK